MPPPLCLLSSIGFSKYYHMKLKFVCIHHFPISVLFNKISKISVCTDYYPLDYETNGTTPEL